MPGLWGFGVSNRQIPMCKKLHSFPNGHRKASFFLPQSLCNTLLFYNISGIPTRNLSNDICALSCNHGSPFHVIMKLFWFIVGENQTRPDCPEKADLKGLLCNPYHLCNKCLIFTGIIQGITYSLVLE
uniref:Uncharacterized protein n=1 Tax=Taeniopygia guttata TaxID=59729 RepID=A0A674HMT4_TAEGU